MEEYKQIFKIAGKDVEISTGKLAPFAQGKVLVKMGGTALFATVSVDKKEAGLDYFPLSVEYLEKMYARGAVSGSRYKKREGLPSDEAVIKAREVDHSLRSLFPKSFKRGVSVLLTVMSYDGENDPQSLTVLGASLALMQAGLPFAGPCASVVVGVDKDQNLIINPSAEERGSYVGEFIVSGVDGKILSLEGWGQELSEEKMDEVLDKSMAEIININKQQNEFISKVGKSLDIDASLYPNIPAPQEVIDWVKAEKYDDIKDALFNSKVERGEQLEIITKELSTKNSEKENPFESMDLNQAIDYVCRRILRDGILKEDKRVSGRKLEEIRSLSGEIDVLPTVHGSALFNRGQTQSLSIVTLAPKSSELLVDEMEGESSKTFMHHYNFPPYSTGEAGRYNFHPGRREIGHGMIGENALKNMIPSEADFPYTIRVVSEILGSNGSTSMAATCASSMALMAAGVPIKDQVAGIGVGLITEDDNEDKYKLILDIEGIEDFYGDMDFKVCGTKNGITAMQYENKLQGVKLDVLKKAFRVAKDGRMQVLQVMNSVIPEPKGSLPANAPIVETVSIREDQIGELIGPGGKNIKGLVEDSLQYGKTEADISIDDFGVVMISASNREQMDYLKSRINSMFKRAEVGDEFDGKVDKVAAFGMFVKDVNSNVSGLVHISEITNAFISSIDNIFHDGDEVRVKVKGIEDGKISLTMKGIKQSEEIDKKIASLPKKK